MLARRDPSRQGKRHNAFSPLFAAPLGKGSVSPLKVGHVDVRRDCPSDDTALAVSVHDMKNAVAVVDLDWQRNENLSFQKTKRHVHWPSPNATERSGSEPDNLNVGNPVTAIIDGRVTTLRRTAELISCCSSGMVNPPTPANDNENWGDAA